MSSTTTSGKPYDTRKQTFLFAREVITAYPAGVRSHVPSAEIWRQLVRAAASVGANVEEANAAGSRADFRCRCKVALREARESLYWLLLIEAARLVGADRARALAGEADELVAILTSIARRSEPPARH